MQSLLSTIHKNWKKYSLKKKQSEIMIYLESGYAFSEIPFMRKSGIKKLSSYLEFIDPSKFKYTSRYLNDLSILKLIIEEDKIKKTSWEFFLSNSLYPLLLLFLYIPLVFFYHFSFSEQIIDSFDDYPSILKKITFYRRLSLLHFGVIIFFLVLIGLFIFLLINKDLLTMFFIVINRALPHNFFRTLLTLQFIRHFKILFEQGLNTRVTIHAIRYSKANIVIRWLGYHMEESFKKGTNWESEFLDPHFKLMVLEAQKKGHLTASFQNYILFAEKLSKERFKVWNFLFKGIVFSLLISLLILYYQTLYLPLSIMEVL